MYKKQVQVIINQIISGQINEIDFNSTEFYAYAYAKKAGITLDDEECGTSK